MGKIEVKKSFIKETLKEVEKLSSQFDKKGISVVNVEQMKEIIWKIYYNIWENSIQYSSVITLAELKEIHEDYHQRVLNLNKKSKLIHND